MQDEAQDSKLAFVFDLDGTLVNSVRGIETALAEAFASIGRTMPQRSLRDVIGPPISVIAMRLEPGLSHEEAAAIETAYRPLYDNGGWLETQLFSGVEATLQTLRGDGHRLFVATNKPRIPTMKILEQLGLSWLVEDVITRDSREPRYAGKREMLAALIERHRLKVAECVMVGDTEEDGEAARANRVRFAYVTYGYGEASHADYRLDTFGELLRIAEPAVVLAGDGGGR